MDTERRRWRVGAARAAVVVVAAGVIGAAFVLGGASMPDDEAVALPPGAVTAGDISVYDAYVREPASPVNAAAYFAVRNDGSDSDELLAVRTDAAPTVSLHDLPGASGHHSGGQLLVAGASTVRLSPGNGHVMLEQPTAALAPGDTVTLVLTFAEAGDLTVRAPVIAIGAEPPGGRA